MGSVICQGLVGTYSSETTGDPWQWGLPEETILPCHNTLLSVALEIFFLFHLSPCYTLTPPLPTRPGCLSCPLTF